MMFIAVLHEITDQALFFASGAEVVEGAPKGTRTVFYFPSTEGEQAMCVWEAPSIDAVRDYLDPAFAACCRNSYYAVNSELAWGLPAPVA